MRVTVIAARVGLYLGACWLTIGALANGLFPLAALAVALVALYTTLPLVVFARWRGWPFYPNAAFRLLVVRPFWYTQLLLPLVAGGGTLGVLVGALFGDALLGGRLAAAAVLFIAGSLLIAGYLGSKELVVRRVEASIPGLATEFDGLVIAQVSDLHVGPHTSTRFLSRVVATVIDARPDVIAVTGDLVDDRAEDVAAYAATVGQLEAPLGVFMIAGNHDVYAGWDAVEHRLRSQVPARLLLNEAHIIRRGDATLVLAGTGDPAGGRRGQSRAAPDVDRALADAPLGATVIALAHNPALWPALVARGVSLTLSGHTHWGQFAVPRLGWSLASPFLKHAMGAYRERDSLLYINPGTGYWGIPFRLGALPEVTVVTLRRAPAALEVGRARRARCA
ncbi:MAG: metallophosphoesterase [Geminicoccaceae bacterium]|jgi:predicted MPP superfamily phosphohydrolase|nr:metallophosphoesterase [Geminicoccaceae bacterium]